MGVRSVEVRRTGHQHILEGEEIVLAPEVERFVEDLKRFREALRRAGICP